MINAISGTLTGIAVLTSFLIAPAAGLGYLLGRLFPRDKRRIAGWVTMSVGAIIDAGTMLFGLLVMDRNPSHFPVEDHLRFLAVLAAGFLIFLAGSVMTLTNPHRRVGGGLAQSGDHS